MTAEDARHDDTDRSSTSELVGTLRCARPGPTSNERVGDLDAPPLLLRVDLHASVFDHGDAEV
jgi:hypothetical protein